MGRRSRPINFDSLQELKMSDSLRPIALYIFIIDFKNLENFTGI